MSQVVWLWGAGNQGVKGHSDGKVGAKTGAGKWSESRNQNCRNLLTEPD